MTTYTITWEDPTGESTTERWTSQHIFTTIDWASVWAQQDGNAHKRPVAVEVTGSKCLYTQDNCAYDDVCGRACHHLPGQASL